MVLLPTFQVYLDDFFEQCKHVDRVVFGRANLPLAGFAICEKFPDVNVPQGTHIGRMASYLFDLPRNGTLHGIHKGNPAGVGDYFVIWKKETVEKLDFLLRRGNISGIGDFALKEFWLMTAITLVRSRVLYHRKWLPRAKYRTFRSLAKHADLFRGDLFKKIRSFETILADVTTKPNEVDRYLTQTLVAVALEQGIHLDAALELVGTD